MKVFSFTYFVNVQENSRGHLTGFTEGYKNGDDLLIAYRGFVAADSLYKGRQRLENAAHALFAIFNHPDMRPAGYRGPSMSVGSVVEIQGVHFAVEPLGWKEVEIWQSRIAVKDVRWTVGNPTDGTVLTTQITS
jgi:hypothetical protein